MRALRARGRDVSGCGDGAFFMHANVLGAMRVLASVVDALAPPAAGAPGARIGVVSSRMGSIGLRQANGRPKLGWAALEREAAAGFLPAPVRPRK